MYAEKYLNGAKCTFVETIRVRAQLILDLRSLNSFCVDLSFLPAFLPGTNTHPSTVVEFVCPKSLITKLFAMQHKAEDGALSHGLGDKGGKGLPYFNQAMQDGEIAWRIVKVKRRVATQQAKRKF